MTREIRGCGTALVTPFRRDGSIDEQGLRGLVQFQLREGIDFLVPCGTTGETPTLEHDEYMRVVCIVVEESAGKVPIVAGAAGNDTRKVIQLAKEVASLGADAILSVAPYYNKPTQEGLYQHFKAIAESVSAPLILYSVPGRTASNIEPATVVRLAQVPGIIGIKEASGNITQQMEILRNVPSSFLVFSGDDALTFPLICLGAVGIVSVAANEIPGPMTKLTRLLLQGRYEEARALHFQWLPLLQANFIETSPIPVKAALSMMGRIEEVYRLPLVPLEPKNRARLQQVLAASGLLSEKAANAGRRE